MVAERSLVLEARDLVGPREVLERSCADPEASYGERGVWCGLRPLQTGVVVESIL